MTNIKWSTLESGGLIIGGLIITLIFSTANFVYDPNKNIAVFIGLLFGFSFLIFVIFWFIGKWMDRNREEATPNRT
tara:strand:+ start:1982 stop:2209 length:228 start_codon:yes stop_codon:yes gene_type:complete